MTDSTARPVRVRFAPSPTGPMHIGGVRTALFNWLFARHNNGKFILRIEDTDRKRFVPGSLEKIYDGLGWLGLNWDEGPDVGGPYGPYVQSERLDLYKKWADWLIDNDKAYRCYCTAERLERVNEERKARKEAPGYDRHCRYLTEAERAEREAQGLPSVVRFKMPLNGSTTVYDMIRGNVQFENSTLQDLVLLKSDGFPTYHLANVVDDHFMEISHIMRANEWLSSAPIHFQLYAAFGWEMPQIAHLPVLLNPNGKGKLSKRSAGFFEDGRKVLVLAEEFKAAGYLPQAVVNFLTNIGWSFGEDREVFSTQEAIERFDIARVNPADSVYPIEKLDWLNGVWIRNLSEDELRPYLREALESAGLTVDDAILNQVLPLAQTRIKTPQEIVELAGFLFRDSFAPVPFEQLIPKKWDAVQARSILEQVVERLSALDGWTHDKQEAEMRALLEESGLKPRDLFGMLRVAATGQAISPPLFETTEIIGKDETLRRLRQAAETVAVQG
ncbi:MAG: glutamate--tRNA ligase [Chloroflexi bacterium]|nr:glutamate--tRNA ligase [Chloroflexota bacterium]